MTERDLNQPLERARLALLGLAVGDAIGGFFEFSQGRLSHHITSRTLPTGIWHWTDDTQMALSTFAVLRQCSRMDQDLFAASLAYRYERARGYGLTSRTVLRRIRQTGLWQEASGAVSRGEGSFGNGGASRVPPLGAFLANDLPEVVSQAALSAVVTHAHPESIAGTIAVAAATALAWMLRSEKGMSRKEFLEQVINFVPESIVREKLVQACNLVHDVSIQHAVSTLGNGRQATVQTTVPFALWCAADCTQSYSEAIWQALEGQGDCDTICAIVGGVTAMRSGYDGIPEDWQQSCEPLPNWAFDESVPALLNLSFPDAQGG